MELACCGGNSEYTVCQLNGQRRYGPPHNWAEGPPPKGTEVFVSNVPRDLRENTIVPIFDKVGKIYTLRLMMDFSGSNRGFCFVQYTNVEDASRAIEQLNGYEIRPGHRIKVRRSVDNRRLFIGQIPRDKTKEEILDKVSGLVSGLSGIILYMSPIDKRHNRGFCFAEFDCHRSAAMARRSLVTNGLRLWNREIRVDWAIPELFVEDKIMSTVTTLLIRNLQIKTTESELKSIVFKFIPRKELVRLRKIRDIAFVHLSSREVAEQLFLALKGLEIDGVEIYVSWARPSSKTRPNQEYTYTQPNNRVMVPEHQNNVVSLKEPIGNYLENALPYQSVIRNYDNSSSIPRSSNLDYSYVNYVVATTNPFPAIGPPLEMYIENNNMLESPGNYNLMPQNFHTSSPYMYNTSYNTSTSRMLQELAFSQGLILGYDVSLVINGTTFYQNPQYQAAVIFFMDGRFHTFPRIQHRPALTPEQAKDFAAEAFINICKWAL